MTSLSGNELRTIYATVQRLEQARKEEIKDLSDLFTENPRLIISPNNKCPRGCLHCVANSTPKGLTMPYDKFAAIDPEFFRIFTAADFGRRGNPLIYNSKGYDLVDMMGLLHAHGVKEFTLALTLQKNHVPEINRLEAFAINKKANIGTMITYHHYFKDLDTDQLAKDFNSTLKNYLGFSNKIVISLLGDEYRSSQEEQTKADEVEETFWNNWEKIFKDIPLTTRMNQKHQTQLGQRLIDIQIPPIDMRVYPLGRFRKYLEEKGTLEQYEKQFAQSMSDYVCPDLIKWPGIIIEPNGDLNMCASFEAINCKNAVITNIFEKPYEQVKEDLMKFYEKETEWFINNLSGIIDGKISTCRLKSRCYR